MHPSAVLGVILAVAAPVPKDPPKKELPVVGEWEGVKAIAGGKEDPLPGGGVTFTFAADGKYYARAADMERPREGTYTVDPKADPAHMDMIPPADDGDRVVLKGIWKVEGDTLTMCFGRRVKDANERPTKFESPEGGNVVLMTFKRAAKKD